MRCGCPLHMALRAHHVALVFLGLTVSGCAMGGCLTTPPLCRRAGLDVHETPMDRGGPPLNAHRAAVVASLGATVPLLPQEVLEFVHELLRVESVVTP